ncbi:hypothetical protein HU200_040716 [Digitaria exilis]|uniref:K Homology domain-containing protein n=1 Tax=Digitaria exilis TaxID=1010633 RepID=A0A835B5P6_9POAL|nr:hypothetical protein HU200_040716 [Digitaria exilis]
MADDHYSSKRKYDDPSPPPRRTGFSSGPPPASPPAGAPSYNSVPPPPDEIQLAKQRAQEIAARIFSAAEAKRPRVDNGDDDVGGYGGGAPLGSSGGGGRIGGGGLGFSSSAGGGHGSSVPPLSSQSNAPSYSSYGGYQGTSKKIEIPNGRVGVIIGKAGETIRYLQLQSGAKIQVTRDNEAEPGAQTRPVELSGTPEQIDKAEQLIKEVLAEVGLVIGKGGETIKSMQAKSGARIQVIPLHLPPGDTSTERTVHIDGTQEQVEIAKQLVIEVPMCKLYFCRIVPEIKCQVDTLSRVIALLVLSQTGAHLVHHPSSLVMVICSLEHILGHRHSMVDLSNLMVAILQHPVAIRLGGISPKTSNLKQPPLVLGTTTITSSNLNNRLPLGLLHPPMLLATIMASLLPIPHKDMILRTLSRVVGSNHMITLVYQTQGQQQGYSQQTGYDQQSYGASAYGSTANSTQDGSAPSYGGTGGASQTSPGKQTSTPAAASHPGYASQPPTASSYPAQGSAPPSGYGAPQPQSAYGTQPPPQGGYGQGSYGQPSPQGQKPPASSPYGQAPPPAQGGYGQYGYSQPGYGAPPPYPGAPPASYPGYGQQQSYGDAYSSGSYGQPPAYTTEAPAAAGSQDQSAAPASAAAATSAPAPANSGGAQTSAES